MHFRCGALDGNLPSIRREPEHDDPIYRLAYLAELLSGSIPPGQLRDLARSGIEQQPCRGRGDTDTRLSSQAGCLPNLSGFSDGSQARPASADWPIARLVRQRAATNIKPLLVCLAAARQPSLATV